MLENQPEVPNQEQNANDDNLFFENRVEEPPFVYLGYNYPADIGTELPGHVFSFEQLWKKAGSIKIIELIGWPFFFSAEHIDKDMLLEELESLMKLLESKNIRVGIPAGTEPVKIYKFITEFLLDQEVDDLNLEGLSRVFFYNENYNQKT